MSTNNNYRLIDSEMFVTLEPCLMCLGVTVNAIKKIYLPQKTQDFVLYLTLKLDLSFSDRNNSNGLMKEYSKIINDFLK